MNNITVGLKKFLSNKNTVTVVGVILAVIVLYVGYNMRVKQATNPVTVAYAKQTISPGVQITEDMVGTTEVPPAMIKGQIISNVASVVGKYSADDSVIPEGSLFYSRSVVLKEQIRSNIILDYPKGYVLYNFPVDMTTTYGNSIYPGNYIDIYLKAINRVEEGQQVTQDKIMVGKLLKNIKVLAVKDANGEAVFSNLDEQRTPSMVIFAVPEKYYILLKKASYLRTYDTTMIPVPTSESLKKKPGELEISDKDLEAFINDKTIWTGE